MAKKRNAAAAAKASGRETNAPIDNFLDFLARLIARERVRRHLAGPVKTPLNRLMVGDRVAIYARGKRGCYQADFHYRGQHRRRSLKSTNRKVAIRRATKLAVEIQEGTLDEVRSVQQPSATKRTTLVAAVKAFIDFKRAAGKRPKTVSKYEGTLKAFAAFAATKHVTRVDQVALLLVDEYQAWRRQQVVRHKKVGPTQLYPDMSLLKRFFQWCADRGMISENPLEKQPCPRPTQRRRECPPTIEQINAILSALPWRIVAPVTVLAFTGMRSANCRNLLVDDIDLDAGWIYVRSREGAETKVGNDWKTPIHPRLAAVLKSLEMPRSGYLFTAPASRKYPKGGHWLNTKHLNDDFVKVVKKLGMPAGREAGFTIHSLRHFFKSSCISHGVPREYVDAWQGHASIRSASDLYVHTIDAESQRLMTKVPFGTGMPAANAG